MARGVKAKQAKKDKREAERATVAESARKAIEEQARADAIAAESARKAIEEQARADAIAAESAHKAIEEQARADAIARENALKERKLEIIAHEARMNMKLVIHNLKQKEEIRKQKLKELSNIKAGEEEISKGETFKGSFLLLIFKLACGKNLAFIVEKKKGDSMKNSAYSHSVIQNFLPEGTSYTKPDTVMEFSSFSDMTLCISDKTSKYYKKSPFAFCCSGPCSITLYNTEVQYFTLVDISIGIVVKQHKRTYFGIVVMFQQILFSVFEKYFASHNIHILQGNKQSPFEKGETTRGQHDNYSSLKFRVSSFDSDYYESYYDRDDRYCRTDCGECEACVGKDGAYNSFPVCWQQVCDSCNKTNEYQFQFELAFDKNSGNYGIIDNTGYKQKFYDIQSILNEFDVTQLFGKKIFTETTCQCCTFESKIYIEIKKMKMKCSDVGIFVNSEHPIRYVIEKGNAKYLIPINSQFDIAVYKNYISVPCLENHYHTQFWNIALMRYRSVMPYSTQEMFWVTLLSAIRFSIQLPSEIWEHIFGFIKILEYDHCKTYIVPFTGDINGSHMKTIMSYIPMLLLGRNTMNFEVKGNDYDDYDDTW